MCHFFDLVISIFESLGQSQSNLSRIFEDTLIVIIIFSFQMKEYVVWEEVFNNGIDIAEKTVVEVWLPYNPKRKCI